MCHGSAVGPGVESGSLMSRGGLQPLTGTTTIMEGKLNDANECETSTQ